MRAYISLAGALALVLNLPLSSLAQSPSTSPPTEVKIESWGAREFALGNFTGTRSLNILAGKTAGMGGALEGKPQGIYLNNVVGNFWSSGGHLVYTGQVSGGQMYDGRVDYVPGGPRFLHVRLWASQGNLFNAGRIILTDASDYRRESARYVYGEAWANGGIPTWQIFLGVVFWITGVGAPVALSLFGLRSGGNEFTIAFPEDVPSITLYYKMTGCTASSDYNGSFTVPLSSFGSGVAYAVDIYGWCGGGGVGNWAMAAQRALVPDPLSLGNQVAYSLYDPNVPGYRITLRSSFQIRGPDDCWSSQVTDPYDYGRGVYFKISGADCSSSGFGAPGNMGGVRTWLPSLTAIANGQWSIEGFSGNDFMAMGLLSSRISNWNTFSSVSLTTSFTPRGYYNGSFSRVEQIGTASTGSETVSGRGIAFYFSRFDSGTLGGNVFDNTSSLSFPQATLNLPNYTGTCTLTNHSKTTVTVYELTPPGSFTANVSSAMAIRYFPRHTISANGGTVTLGRPGFYYYTPGSVPLNSSAGLTASCTLGTYANVADTDVHFFPGFFYLQ